MVLPRLSEGILRGRQTLLRNWVIIKVTFGFTGKQAVGRRLIEMGFAPPAMERYFSGPSLVFGFRKCMAMLMIKELIIFQGFQNTVRERGRAGNKDDIIALSSIYIVRQRDSIRHVQGSFDMIFTYMRESI